MSIRHLQISINTPYLPPPPPPPKKMVFLLGISVDQRDIEEILLGVGVKMLSYGRCANAKFSHSIPFC